MLNKELMPLNPLFQHSIIPTFQGVLKPEKPLNLDLAHRRSRYAGKDQVFFARINGEMMGEVMS